MVSREPPTKVDKIQEISFDWPLAIPLTRPNFVALRQKVCEIAVAPGKSRPKFILGGHQIYHQSIDRTRVSINTLIYSNFGSSRLLRFRDIAAFVSQMPLLYIPPRLPPKIWRCSPLELDR